MAVIIPSMTVYTSAYIHQSVYASRMSEQGGMGHKTLVYYLNYSRGRYCALIYKPDAYGRQHIGFYALSEGWDVLTETGYLSYFFSFISESGSVIPSCHDMRLYWREVCQSAGLDLMGMSGGYQASLF